MAYLQFNVKLASKPSLIKHKDLKFLIMDRPTESNLHVYLRELKKVGVTDIVRVCEETYSSAEVVKSGIKMHEIPFADGKSPPDEVIVRWLEVVTTARKQGGCVAVHCVAGLGRAPVLVAVALIDNGTKAIDAIEMIRKERKSALNNSQIKFLRDFEPISRKGACRCVIS